MTALCDGPCGEAYPDDQIETCWHGITACRECGCRDCDREARRP